jgi:hypothetical protein
MLEVVVRQRGADSSGRPEGVGHDGWTLISHEQQLPHPDAETAVSIVLQQTAVALPSSCVLQILCLQMHLGECIG